MRLVGEADGLGLDGDAALLLEVHVVEDLAGHLAVRQPAAGLDQAVGQGALPVVNVGDDGEVADEVERGIGHRSDVGGLRGNVSHAGGGIVAGARPVPRLRRAGLTVARQGFDTQPGSPSKLFVDDCLII